VANQRQWVEKVRDNPKQAMEADFSVAVVGLVIVFMGGLISVAGVHPAFQTVSNDSPAPVFGALIVFAGLFVVALGVILLATSLLVWISGRLHVSEGRSDEGGAPSPGTCPNDRRYPHHQGDVIQLSGQHCPGGGKCTPLSKAPFYGIGYCLLASALGGVAWLVGGGAALVVGGFALLVFVAGAWTLVVTGGFLILIHCFEPNRKKRRKGR
jgi:hypothetical protein